MNSAAPSPIKMISCPVGERKIVLYGALPLVLAGLILSVWGYYESIQRFALNYLIAFLFVWVISLGSLFYVALHHVTGAVWSVVVRRVAEIFSAPLPVLAILFIPILFLAKYLYPWLDQAFVAKEEIVKGKLIYLNFPFFLIRSVFYLIVWMAFGTYFVRLSVRQDNGGAGSEATLAMRGCSALFLLFFALTVTFASFDWIMSLQPTWFSTIYGVYIFAGMAVAALCVITLATLWMRGARMFGEFVITDDHIYSLGALLFAFSCFWGYISLSQFLLIWYGNMPEETFWYNDRWWQGGWKISSLLLISLRFFLPFLALLSRSAKTNTTRLVWVSILLLIGQVVDLRWLVLPGSAVAGTLFRWGDLGPLFLLCGIYLFFIGRFIGKNSVVAVGDPLLKESLDFELTI